MLKEEKRQELQAIGEKLEMRPTAIADLLDLFVDGFDNIPLRHTASGLLADEWLERQKTVRPHWWPTVIEPDLEAQAFGLRGEKENMTAKGKLFKQLGAVEYAEAEARAKAELGKETKLDTSRTNPWVRGDHKEMAEFIKRCGTKAASGLARAAGRTIDGRPLRA